MNISIFRDCLKLFPPIIGLRKLSGREFQTDGPATESLLAIKAESVAWYDQDL